MTETLPAETTAPETSLLGHSTTQSNLDQELQLVTFHCGEEEFAIDILQVQEINRMMEITTLPQSHPSLMGVVNLRGVIIPVVDLRERFGFTNRELTASTRIVVVNIKTRIVGFVVDEVREVLRVKESCFEDKPSMCGGVDSDYIKGIGKLEDRLLILLDITRVLSEDTLNAIDQNQS